MLVYFDTNVYSMISELSQEKEVLLYLNEKQMSVICSFENIIETARAPKEEAIKRIAIIKRLTSHFLGGEVDHYCIKEMLCAVRKTRSHILYSKPNKFDLANKMRISQRTWKKLRNNSPYSFYIDFISASKKHLEFIDEYGDESKNIQKQYRTYAPQSKKIEIILPKGKYSHLIEGKSLDENYWRVMSLDLYLRAMNNQNFSASETRFWLDSYINWKNTKRDDWHILWLSEIQEQDVPLQVMRCRAYALQHDNPVTKGNLVDGMHAAYMPYCDLFVTCDRIFYRTLQLLKEKTPIKMGRVVLVDRSAKNFPEALNSAILNC